MRLSPLAVWCYRLGDDELAKAVRAEVGLTHVNEVNGDACVCYCMAIASLVSGANASKAYNRVKAWISSNGSKGIREWFEYIESHESIETKKRAGWTLISLFYSFRFLRAEAALEEAYT